MKRNHPLKAAVMATEKEMTKKATKRELALMARHRCC
jgi:hypothetical protein